jgi:TM2 domain-containing membrane protein YozV
MARTIFVTIIVLIFISFKAEAGASAFLFLKNKGGVIVQSINSLPENDPSKNEVFKKKVTAIGLAIVLGPLGMHRLYLGTDYRVPVIYAITLGGFGVLPLIDIVAIIATKDIAIFENNQQIIMWTK